MAASHDQLSPHVLARAVVKAAEARGLPLALPEAVEEVTGQGIWGKVDGHAVAVGEAAWAGVAGSLPWAGVARRRARLDGTLTVFVSIDGEPAGVVVLEDPFWTDIARTGPGRTAEGHRADRDGDRRPPRGGRDVRRGHRRGRRRCRAFAPTRSTLCVRSVVERRPSWSATASTTRQPWRSPTRGWRWAYAALGWLPAVRGALLQERTDVAVIVNALRALRTGPDVGRLDTVAPALARRFAEEHASIRMATERLRTVADALGTVGTATALAQVRQVHRMLVEEVVPHEDAEDRRAEEVATAPAKGRWASAATFVRGSARQLAVAPHAALPSLWPQRRRHRRGARPRSQPRSQPRSRCLAHEPAVPRSQPRSRCLAHEPEVPRR